MTKVDRWIQRMTLAAMVALAIGLLGVGVSLYAHPTATVESSR